VAGGKEERERARWTRHGIKDVGRPRERTRLEAPTASGELRYTQGGRKGGGRRRLCRSTVFVFEGGGGGQTEDSVRIMRLI